MHDYIAATLAARLPAVADVQSAYSSTTQTPVPAALAYGAAASDSSGRVYLTGGLGQGSVGSSTVYRWEGPGGAVTTLASLPVALAYHAAVCDAAGRVYVTGGWNLTTGTASTALYRYDPATGAWSTLTAAPRARVSGGAVLDQQGRLVVVGGSTTQAVSTAQATCDRYDPVAGTWTTGALPALPTALSKHGTAIDSKGRITVAGGVSTTSAWTQAVYRYDPAVGAWSTLLVSIPGTEAALVCDGADRVWAIGGSTSSGIYTSNVYMWDPSIPNSVYSGLITLPAATGGMAATVDSTGRAWLLGGNTAGGYVTTATRYYLGNAGFTSLAGWTQLGTMPSMLNRLASSTNGAGLAFFSHGWYPGSYAKTGVVVDTATGVATTMSASASTGRDTACGFFYNGKHYVVGGQNASGALSSIDVYTPAGANGATGTWATTVALPTPLSAAAAAVTGGYVWLAGGRTSTTAASATNAFYRFDGATFTAMASLPVALYGGALVAVGARLHYVGGSTATGVNTAVYVYDTTAGVWSTLATSGTGASSTTTAAAIGATIYAWAGIELYALDTNTGAWFMPIGMSNGNPGSGTSPVMVAAGSRLLRAAGWQDNAVRSLDTAQVAGGPKYLQRVRALRSYLAATDPVSFAAGQQLTMDLVRLNPAWSLSITPAPAHRSGAAFCSDAVGNIYSINGRQSGTPVQSGLLRDATTGAWSSIAMPPFTSTALLRAVCDSTGRVFVWVGTSAPDAAASIYCYDPSSNAWSLWWTGVGAPNYCADAAVCIDATDRIYIIGGSAAGAQPSTGRFTIASRAWEAITAEPTSTRRCAGAVFDPTTKTVVVVGGLVTGSGTTTATAVTTRFGVDSGQWTIGAAMPTAGAYFAYGRDARNRVIVAGGSSTDGTATSSGCYRYTASTDGWETLPAASTRSNPQGGTDAAGRFLMWGGDDSHTYYYTTLDALVPESNYGPVSALTRALTTAN